MKRPACKALVVRSLNWGFGSSLGFGVRGLGLQGPVGSRVVGSLN